MLILHRVTCHIFRVHQVFSASTANQGSHQETVS